MRKADITVAVSGTLLEWAEYTYFAYLAVRLAKLFFPDALLSQGLVFTFGMMAAGYVLRPLGAYWFGRIGDTYGRKPALLWSMWLMGCAAIGCGLLPEASAVGGWAAIGMLVCRGLQGIAVGGEFNGAAIYLYERSNPKYRYFAPSLVSASAALGMVLGGILAALVTRPEMPHDAWRIPFLVGGCLCFASGILRHRMQESLPTARQDPSHTLPAVKIPSRLVVTTTIMVSATVGVFVYTCNVFYVAFLVQHTTLPLHKASLIGMYGELGVAALIPIVAYRIRDFSHGVRLMRYALLGITVWIPWYFYFSASSHLTLLILLQISFALLNALLCGPMFGVLIQLYATSTRYMRFSVGWSIAAAVFSGTAASVAQALFAFHPILPGLYVSIIAFFTARVLARVLKFC